MICKECGAKIERLTRICPHCGERALIDDELETWSFIADTADKHRREMPEIVALNDPVPIPTERAAQIDGLPLSPFLPEFVWAYYFVLWGAVTTIGYLRAGRRYERRKAEYALLRRHAENDLHAMYNDCADCFLPLAWTPPPRINRMIDALRSGEFATVGEYILKNDPGSGKKLAA